MINQRQVSRMDHADFTWAYVRQKRVQPAVVVRQAAVLVVTVRPLTLHHEGTRHL